LIFLSFYHSFQTRPGPRPGSRVLTGSLGQLFFLKSKRHYFCKKKTKVNGLQPGLAGSTGSLGQPAGSAGSHWVFPSLIFFFNLARFQPRVGRVPGWPARPGRISKLCILHLAYLSLFFIFIFRNIFLVFIFFSLHFFGKKILFFIFYTLNIHHSTFCLYIYIYIFVLSLLFFCDFFIFILKIYYTKTKKMVFHNNNYNIALFFCYVKS
jgi:hypothetical protein